MWNVSVWVEGAGGNLWTNGIDECDLIATVRNLIGQISEIAGVEPVEFRAFPPMDGCADHYRYASGFNFDGAQWEIEAEIIG